jgi:hypothetical protein
MYLLYRGSEAISNGKGTFLGVASYKATEASISRNNTSEVPNMNKKIRLALLSTLTMLFVLTLSFVPVFAEEIAPVETDPILVTSVDGTTVDPDAKGDPDSGVVEGSEGGTEPVTATDGTAVDPTVDDGTMTTTDDGTVNVLDDGIRTLGGTDLPEDGTDKSADDQLGAEAYQTLGANNSATTPWLLLAGVALAGLLVGFGAGFLARRPAKSTTV